MEELILLAGLAHTKNCFGTAANTSAFSDLAEYSGDLLRMQYNDIRLNCTVVSSSECNTITFDQSEAQIFVCLRPRTPHRHTLL